MLLSKRRTWELLENKIHNVTHQNIVAADAFDMEFFADLKLYMLISPFLIDDL